MSTITTPPTHASQFTGESQAKDHRAIESTLWTWANAYKVSLAIFTLSQLGILEKLTSETLGIEEIASRYSCSKELLGPVLMLLFRVGLLEQTGNSFRAHADAQAVLPLLAAESQLYASHITAAKLTQVIQSGQAASVFDTAGAQEYLPHFTAAMRASARTLAPHLLRFGKLRESTHLLDLGGADGALALALRRFVPELSVTVLDLPRMEEPFRTHMAAEGVNDKVRFQSGDLRMPDQIVDCLKQADTVIASNVVHLLSSSHRQALYEAIKERVAAGGRLIVYEQFVEDSGSLRAADFLTIDWVVNGVDFRESAQALCDCLCAVGFSDVYSRCFPGLPGALVYARV